uniref:WW domain-binding protein 4 n=1 Tax=Naja naja TaxID=35670 RepID=A0A8C6Y3P6_NAJNA
MADYWKSQPKKFCDYCKCWIADNKPSIDFHERGKNHKENVAKKISEIKQKSLDKVKEDEKMAKDFAAMEEAATKAYQEDLKRLGLKAGRTPMLSNGRTIIPILCFFPVASLDMNVKTVWVEGTDDNGRTYYYNKETGGERFYSGRYSRTFMYGQASWYLSQFYLFSNSFCSTHFSFSFSEKVDLELPSKESNSAPVVEVPEDAKVIFKEKTVTSLGETTEEMPVFRKRKFENGKSRNFRQRLSDH